MTINERRDSVETEKVKVFWVDDITLCVQIFPGILVQNEDIELILDFQRQQNVGFANKRIIFAEEDASITKEAREMVQDLAPSVIAEAYVMHGSAQRILFNMYVKLRKQSHPIKSFRTFDDGMSWLDLQT